MHIKQIIAALALTTLPLASIQAADYVIDTKGAHAAINFKIPHLGYSWLTGRFNKFSGEFSYDPEAPEKSSISLTVDTASIDSNHAERDKHLRDEDFLYTGKFSEAKFVSTSYRENSDGSGQLKGNLSLRGVTRPISIAVQKVGAGHDPWGGYRQGFSGTTKLVLKDFGIDFNLGKASREVQLELYIEGIRKESGHPPGD